MFLGLVIQLCFSHRLVYKQCHYEMHSAQTFCALNCMNRTGNGWEMISIPRRISLLAQSAYLKSGIYQIGQSAGVLIRWWIVLPKTGKVENSHNGCVFIAVKVIMQRFVRLCDQYEFHCATLWQLIEVQTDGFGLLHIYVFQKDKIKHAIDIVPGVKVTKITFTLIKQFPSWQEIANKLIQHDCNVMQVTVYKVKFTKYCTYDNSLK